MTRPYHRSPLPSEASLSESVPVVSETMAPPSTGQAHTPRPGYVASGYVTGVHILPPEIAPIEPSTTQPAQFYVNSMKSIHIQQELDQLMTSQSILRTVLAQNSLTSTSGGLFTGLVDTDVCAGHSTFDGCRE